MPPDRRLLAAACAALLRLVGAGAGAGGSCPAGAPCRAASGPEDPWPTARGRAGPGLYGVSQHAAPGSWGKRLAWAFPGARGNHSSVFVGGVAIDGERNVYTAAFDCIYKLNASGSIVWLYPVRTSNAPVIHTGALYSTSNDGRMFALDMKTGTKIWETQVSERIGQGITSTGVSDGIVIGGTHGKPDGVPTDIMDRGNAKVTGVNASDGTILWQYEPAAQLLNFVPVFTGEGTFVFQDQIGGVYHLRTATGEVIWKSGYAGHWVESFSAGAAMIGPNRKVYVVHADCAIDPSAKYPPCTPLQPGTVSAYQLDTGELVWEQATPYSPSSQPLVAKLGSAPGLTLVLPMGLPAGLPPSLAIWGWPLPDFLKNLAYWINTRLGDSQVLLWKNTPWRSLVQAYDAETGARRWSWAPPDLVKGFSAGDEELLLPRLKWAASRQFCTPSLWAGPTADAEGTLFLGHASGRVYALRDADGDGALDPRTEVAEFDAQAAFGHPGLGLAPGMAVVASCDAVLAFKD